MHWENLSNQLPEARRSLVADNEMERDIIIHFAEIGEPGPAHWPGQNPHLYKEQPAPVLFNRTVSQYALRGAREVLASNSEDVWASMAKLIFEALEVDGAIPRIAA